MKIIQEFKEFAIRGSVIDLAVGVIIGVAFGKIVTSLVNDIIIPPIGMVLGGLKFNEYKLVLRDAVTEGGKVVTEGVTINYGNFIQVTFEFMVIAFVIFLFVKVANKIRRKEVEKPAEPAPLTKQEQLLTEIRDLMAERK